jgi:hypothetical protein
MMGGQSLAHAQRSTGVHANESASGAANMSYESDVVPLDLGGPLYECLDDCDIIDEHCMEGCVTDPLGSYQDCDCDCDCDCQQKLSSCDARCYGKASPPVQCDGRG